MAEFKKLEKAAIEKAAKEVEYDQALLVYNDLKAQAATYAAERADMVKKNQP